METTFEDLRKHCEATNTRFILVYDGHNYDYEVNIYPRNVKGGITCKAKTLDHACMYAMHSVQNKMK